MTLALAIRFLLSNIWRTACIALALTLGVAMWAGSHWENKLQKCQAASYVALDANRASQEAIASLKAELVASSARYAVYVDNARAVELARIKADREAAEKLKRSQDALRKALEGNRIWSDTPVPDNVRKALR